MSRKFCWFKLACDTLRFEEQLSKENVPVKVSSKDVLVSNVILFHFEGFREQFQEENKQRISVCENLFKEYVRLIH